MKHPRAFHPLDPRGARMRLILAAGVASLAWLAIPAIPARVSLATRALLAWDLGGLILLGFAALVILRSDAKETRRRAAAYDPGHRVVGAIVLAASSFSLFAAAVLLRQGHDEPPATRGLHAALCVATVAISWLITHSAFTLRYAHLYYRNADRGGGIEFPGDDAPSDLDFAYFAFTIGMTFQTSDTQIASSHIRRAVLSQALLSFLYNTVILAFALNLIVGELG